MSSKSACLRASAARSADARIELPEIVSRDFVPMAEGCVHKGMTHKPLHLRLTPGRATRLAALCPPKGIVKPRTREA
jgi:hypothetical protein